jgi:thioesterase domain-containing protein/acyl carrier protein
VEQVLAQIWAEVLNVERVGRDDDFFRSGGDSLSAAHLLVQIEQRLGRKLPMASLLEEATLASLARRLSQPDEAVVPALVELQPRGSQPPFFCVHGVGGEVLAFADLAQQMAPDQPFYAFQTRRVNGVQEPFRHVEPAAAHYLEELRAVQPEGPYYLGGFSFGGCVAFEMAQQLRAQGQQVALLAIIDQAAPPARFGRGVWGPAFAWEFLRNLPYWLKEDLLLSLCQGSDGCAGVLTRLRLKAQALKRRVSRLLGRPGSGSVRTDVEETFDVARLPEHFRKLIEAHYEALRGYVPQVYPGRVTLFRSRARPLFQVHGHDLGWGELAGGGLEVIVLPGNHESILKAPLVRTLAERLKVAIRTARAASQQANGPEGAHHLTPALTPRA